MSKIFIYSENLRGRRPVIGRVAGKDPNDNGYHLQLTGHARLDV